MTGAVQAARWWTQLPDGTGYIYSFNGPHSLFADTIRSMRALAVVAPARARADGRGGRADRPARPADPARRATPRQCNVTTATGRDAYDVRGRTAHESIFNLNDGDYRCPSSQQGYSPFSTWTRGLAWIMCGYPEQLEFSPPSPEEALEPYGGRRGRPG